MASVEGNGAFYFYICCKLHLTQPRKVARPLSLRASMHNQEVNGTRLWFSRWPRSDMPSEWRKRSTRAFHTSHSFPPLEIGGGCGSSLPSLSSHSGGEPFLVRLKSAQRLTSCPAAMVWCRTISTSSSKVSELQRRKPNPSSTDVSNFTTLL